MLNCGSKQLQLTPKEHRHSKWSSTVSKQHVTGKLLLCAVCCVLVCVLCVCCVCVLCAVFDAVLSVVRAGQFRHTRNKSRRKAGCTDKSSAARSRRAQLAVLRLVQRPGQAPTLDNHCRTRRVGEPLDGLAIAASNDGFSRRLLCWRCLL